MKTLYPLRRRDESAWSAYVAHRTTQIERKYRRDMIESVILGVLLFGAAVCLLDEPIAYFVARFCQ